MHLKKIAIFVALLASLKTFAADMPEHCQSSHFQYQHGEIVLHPQNHHHSLLYLLHNNSDITVILNHQVLHPSASAGWGSQIQPDNWSALMVTQPNFRLLCAKSYKNHLQTVSCEKILDVCYFDHFVDKESLATGTFWVVENAAYPEIINKMRDRKLFLIEQ